MTYATKYHYDANKDLYKRKARLRIDGIRKEVATLKESNPCTDCGVYYPAIVMEFDHTNSDKIDSVARLINSGNRTKIYEEIAKCELVCANCHRLRTLSRLLAGSTEASTLS